MERIWTKPRSRAFGSLRGRPKVFAAMSGGVDSSVAAALLKKRGFNVHGVHIKMWSDPRIPCNFKHDRYDAMRVAEKLNIPFETWDFTEDYRKAVVEYMIREYAAGRTPNPDVMCNRHIKFGIFLKQALARGADYVATGHYVKIQNSPPRRIHGLRPSKAKQFAFDSKCKIQNDNEKFKIIHRLYQAKDNNKDQSYFLWTLTQEQLKHCLFPIGRYVKPEVREMARKFELPTAEKKDSQGICFIGEIDLREFLKNYIPVEHGRVLTTSGKVVGGHEGLSFYTVGQRQGIGIGGGIPFYVAEKDFDTNTLIVAEGPYDEKLFAKELIATDVNWISGKEPSFPLRCKARIRYRQPLEPCIVKLEAGSQKLEALQLKVTFSCAQRAITPGQSIVFYQGGEMLGGGAITV